jgi:nucleoside phosphorylase
MAILYVASEAFELEPFANLLTGLRKLKWPIDYAFEGIWEGRRVMLAANGPGAKLATQAVEVAIRAVTAAELSSSRLEAVVSTGCCGALVPDLREGQIVVGTEVLDAETQETFACAAVTAATDVTSGLIITQKRIANDSVEKQQLGTLGGIAVDMEAAAVAARAKRAGLPFSCIKVISDRLDESFSLDFNEMRTIEGRMARGKIMVYALSHPKLIPGLVRLKRRIDDASRTLGDFLVSCRINAEPKGAQSE